MTLVEFLEPLKKSTQKELVVAALYYKQHYEGAEALTVEQVRSALKAARVKGWKTMNVSRALDQSGEFVESAGSKGKSLLWKLTETGRKHVREVIGLPDQPEIEHDISRLSALTGKVSNPLARDYIEEALGCLSIAKLRACVVFLWAGAIRTLHEKMLAEGKPALNDALKKHYPKAKTISRVEDFAYIEDSTALEAALTLGVLDKSERDTLKENLGLRNRCGHPGKYKPAPEKTRAFITDVISIIFA